MKLLSLFSLATIFATLGLMGILQKKPRAIKLGNIIPMRNAPEGMQWL